MPADLEAFGQPAREAQSRGDLGTALGDETLLAHVDVITIHRNHIEVQLTDPKQATLTIPASIVRPGKQLRIAAPPSAGDDAHPDPALIKLVVKAHMARSVLEDHQDRTLDAVAEAAGYTRNYFAMLLRIGFLAPDITAAIFNGRQPTGLTGQRLARQNSRGTARVSRAILKRPKADFQLSLKVVRDAVASERVSSTISVYNGK